MNAGTTLKVIYPFCRNDDSRLIAEFKLKAPEVLKHKGKWHIGDLSDFKGTKLAHLEWVLRTAGLPECCPR
jgi:hypothetical protein